MVSHPEETHERIVTAANAAAVPGSGRGGVGLPRWTRNSPRSPAKTAGLRQSRERVCANRAPAAGRIGGAAWTTPILPRTSRSARVRSERARTRPHRRRPLQRSSGDSARVAAWRLLRFVRGSTRPRVVPPAGACWFRRRAAVSTELDGDGLVSPAAFPLDPARGGERRLTSSPVATRWRRGSDNTTPVVVGRPAPAAPSGAPSLHGRSRDRG
jgi:hypothetical protein